MGMGMAGSTSLAIVTTRSGLGESSFGAVGMGTGSGTCGCTKASTCGSGCSNCESDIADCTCNHECGGPGGGGCGCGGSCGDGPLDKVKDWVKEQVEKVQTKASETKSKSDQAREKVASIVSGIGKNNGQSGFADWWQEHTDGEWGDKWAGRLTSAYDSLSDGETPLLDELTDGEFRESFGSWWEEHTDGEWGDKWAGKLTGVYDNLTDGEPGDWRDPVGDKTDTAPPRVCDDDFSSVLISDLGSPGDCGGRTCADLGLYVGPGSKTPWMVDATESELEAAGWQLPRMVDGSQEIRDLVARAFVFGRENTDLVEWVACKVTPKNGVTYRCLRKAFTGNLPTVKFISGLDQPKTPWAAAWDWAANPPPGATGGGGVIRVSSDHPTPESMVLAAQSTSQAKRICALISMTAYMLHEIGHASCGLLDESANGPAAHEPDCSKPNRATGPYLGWAMALRYWPWVCNCCANGLLTYADPVTLSNYSTYDLWRYVGSWYPTAGQWANSSC